MTTEPSTGKARCELLAEYMTEHKTTVRETAARFGISKSTVHTDISERLKDINFSLYTRARALLDENKAQRHLRGGLATKKKYEQERLTKTRT